MTRAPAVCLAALILLLGTAGSLLAGHQVQTDIEVVQPETEFPFEKGNFELQVLAGSFFSINHSPNFDYGVATVRAGWMLNTPSGGGFCRGNAEFLLEVFGGPVFDGPGDGLVGATLMLRYNFVQPDASVVPYIQIGAGGLYSNAYEDHSQRLIGSAFEFNLQASLGVRFFLTERCALVLEGGYRHISNANISDRNVGVDAIGGQIGVSCFF